MTVGDFQKLVVQAKKYESELAVTNARLDDARRSAAKHDQELMAKYGTSNLEELNEKLATMRANQEERLTEIKSALDTIAGTV